MKQVKLDPTIERTILIGVIVSDEVISPLSKVYKPEFIESDYIKTVCNWCFEFYEKYGKAPKKNIKDIYKQKKRTNKVDDSHMDNIAKVLQLASKQFKRSDKYNYPYVLDTAKEYFDKQALKKFSRDIESMVDDGNLSDCKSMVARFNLASIEASKTINPLIDKDAIREAFTNNREPLFKMPGELGRLLNQDLCRESFLGILGPEKIGKTWHLLEFLMQAAKQRCNVALFQAGDMTEAQQLRRIHIRLAGKSDLKKHCGTFFVPKLDCIKNQLDTCDLDWRTSDIGLRGILRLRQNEFNKNGIMEAMSNESVLSKAYKRAKRDEYKTCTKCIKRKPFMFSGSVWYDRMKIENPLTWKEAYREGKKFQRRMGRKYFRMKTYSSDTLMVREINNALDIMEKEDNFIPDVVGIDYPDIMLAEDLRLSERNQINSIWKGLRRLSQDRKCCVIAPTQADAASYDQESLTPKNFSEDKRKAAHVTSMISLNRTSREKKLGIMRIGQLFVRDDDYNLRHQVAVINCLRRGRPYIASFKHFSY